MGMNLKKDQRAQRKLLITVAEWFGASHDIYKILNTEPEDWSTNYTDYYEKVDGEYVPVSGGTAPAFVAGKYYAKESTTRYREILGTRTEDSSIELNPDIQVSTDIRGITHTDVNKTEPQQTFDPYYLLGESPLGEYLNNAMLENEIDNYNGVFNVYIITAYIGTEGAFKTVQHSGCSIIPTALGGDAYVNMPIEVHLSNNIVKGSVDVLDDNFVFTPTINI